MWAERRNESIPEEQFYKESLFLGWFLIDSANEL
jgi:hypothetical protein